jgi:hypothetical protein
MRCAAGMPLRVFSLLRAGNLMRVGLLTGVGLLLRVRPAAGRLRPAAAVRAPVSSFSHR